ncbi:hypothetical protein [Streptosporangium sp. CA-115845]
MSGANRLLLRTVVVTPDQVDRMRNADMRAPRAAIESMPETAHPVLT